MGFSSFRDTGDRSASGGTAKDKILKDDSDMDSDEDDGVKGKAEKPEDPDIQESIVTALSPDDVKRQGELAEGVQKIRVELFSFRGYMSTLSMNFILIMRLFTVKETTFG